MKRYSKSSTLINDYTIQLPLVTIPEEKISPAPQPTTQPLIDPLEEAKKKLALNNSLLEASKKGDLQIVKSLLSNGAEIECVDEKEGMTPLLIATVNQHSTVVQHILDCGANKEAKSKDTQSTALILACINGSLDIAKILISHGVDIDGTNWLGSTALMVACSGNHIELIKFLIENHASLNIKNTTDATAIHYVLQHPKLDATKLLLDNGADANAFCKNEFAKTIHNGTCSPLIYACIYGNLKLAELLVAKGADINLSDHAKSTPIMFASQKGHFHIVTYLLKLGAKLTTTAAGFTNLMFAVLGENLNTVTELIKQKENVNAMSSRNETPLTFAIQKNNLVLVELLIKNGANLYPSYLSYAEEAECTHPVLDYLRKQNHLIQELFVAAKENDIEYGAVLLRRGLSPNVVDDQNNTPLIIASRHGHLNFVKMLVSKGADIHKKNTSNNNALAEASNHEQLHVSTYLIECSSSKSIPKSQSSLSPTTNEAKSPQPHSALTTNGVFANVKSATSQTSTGCVVSKENIHP